MALKMLQREGRASSTVQNAKLEVSFFRPFWGDYWIIDLGPDYEYAVVGHPSRDSKRWDTRSIACKKPYSQLARERPPQSAGP